MGRRFIFTDQHTGYSSHGGEQDSQEQVPSSISSYLGKFNRIHQSQHPLPHRIEELKKFIQVKLDAKEEGKGDQQLAYPPES